MLTGVEAHEVLRDLAALHRRDRRQRQPSRQVTRGVDVPHVGLAVVVHGDVAVRVHLDTRVGEAERLAVGDGADREHGVGSDHDAAVVTRDAHRVAFTVDRGGARALQELDAAAEERVLEHCRHLGVLLRKDLLARDDE